LAITGLFVGAAGATCEIVGTLTVPGWVALGVDHDGGSIWVTSMPNDGRYNFCLISKFSETTLQLEAQSQEFPWNGRGICHAAGYLWVTDALADVVHVVDPTTFQEIGYFSSPGSEPCGITYDGSSLWLTDPWAGATYQLDLSGNVIGSFSIPDFSRRGLDWHDSLLYTPSDLTTIISYTTGGQSDETYVLDCLPAGADICDLAIAPGGAFLYVSNLNRDDGRVYVLSMSPVPTEGMSWGEMKSLFR
jgi:DNA-binding beta-propeller fold protein YncE